MFSRDDKFHKMFMDVAYLNAKMSYCKRKQVGAVLVNDRRILATGYNGTLPRTPNECEDENGVTSDYTLHAEQNIITYCAKHGIPLKNSTMYITHSPCKHCAKLIASSGIKAVYYSEDYKDKEPIEFLLSLDIRVKQIKKDA